MIAAGQLDRRFIGLRAAVAEEHQHPHSVCSVSSSPPALAAEVWNRFDTCHSSSSCFLSASFTGSKHGRDSSPPARSMKSRYSFPCVVPQLAARPSDDRERIAGIRREHRLIHASVLHRIHSLTLSQIYQITPETSTGPIIFPVIDAFPASRSAFLDNPRAKRFSVQTRLSTRGSAPSTMTTSCTSPWMHCDRRAYLRDHPSVDLAACDHLFDLLHRDLRQHALLAFDRLA